MKWKDDLAQQIKNARESANLTQEQLAGKIHVNRRMVSRYETGRDVPVIDTLVLIASILDVNFVVNGLEIAVVTSSQRLRSVPKQLRLDFEKLSQYPNAVVSITPRKGEILITTKIPA